MEYPRLRYVDAFPIETNNGQMFALRDPNGISTETLLLSPHVFYLLQFFDGKHSIIDLQKKYKEAFDAFISQKQLLEALQHLDKHFFLDNESFSNRLQKNEEDFSTTPLRPAAHAGTSYEDDPEKLKLQLAGYFASAKSAGFPEIQTKNPIRGLVVPHIDIRAGGLSYGRAYQELIERGGADCYVILGTGHSGLQDLYSVIDKDFDTPLGAAKCDTAFIQQLTKNYPRAKQSEVLPHKTEHVIEFQLVFLKYIYNELLKNGADFTFAPVLCSFSYHMLTMTQFERERKIIAEFSQALRKTISRFDKRVCIISSVDFCHVGPRYGDQGKVTGSLLEKVKLFDHKMIQSIQQMDAAGYRDVVAQEKDRFRVCGYSSIYTMLSALQSGKGELLDYSKAEVDEKQSTVTFASMALD